jgi:hypothetical protein
MRLKAYDRYPVSPTRQQIAAIDHTVFSSVSSGSLPTCLNHWSIASTKRVGKRMPVPIHRCISCSSADVIALEAEFRVRLPRLNGLMKSVTLHCPKVFTCLDCGLMQDNLSPTDLDLIRNLCEVGPTLGISAPENRAHLSSLGELPVSIFGSRAPLLHGMFCSY